MTTPLSHEEHTPLDAGSRQSVEIIGDEIELRPERPRKSLAERLAATPPGLCRAQDWDALGISGAEL